MSTSSCSVREIMTDRVIGIEDSCSVGDTLRLAQDEQVHHFPVFASYRLVGFVCTCDLREAPLESPVSTWMHREIAEITPGASTGEAARAMNSLAVGSLLVRDARGIRGIVTRADLRQQSGELDTLFGEARCAFCQGREHLRAKPEGIHVCLECLERANADDWFDIGLGD
jgi:predicted transcriptional regulator